MPRLVMMNSIRRYLAASAALAILASPACAQSLPDDLYRAELLPGWQTPEGTRMAALRLSMAKGWKTYWRAPGEAGIPPVFDWSGSKNVASVTYHWPAPEVFELSGYTTFGFHDELVLPIEIRPQDASQPITASAEVELGICEDICVPVAFTISAELSGSEADTRIRQALASMPEDARDAGLTGFRCTVEPIRDGLRLTATLTMPPLGREEVAVLEAGAGDIWVSPAETRREGGTLVSVADLVPPTARPFALDRSSVVVTVLAPGRAVQEIGCTG
ncbi:protein-disulfide reductase DsbD family protein [Defluviimonas sp. WL0002]|uniref:Protein-disulfide reductase DsbD family protein n=1 Tax=Albidovulum marisflavi TaxID=2984159 RepID=A0ABT2Z7R7_9RHOB|nr:protein-disulfide reductase DsbD domain-containing protein [Defluviimonas sp. WL0002]MCV2867179.1 protein-disulfide reductase DsbD family protein [Defluviimonas sp. WL0002]